MGKRFMQFGYYEKCIECNHCPFSKIEKVDDYDGNPGCYNKVLVCTKGHEMRYDDTVESCSDYPYKD